MDKSVRLRCGEILSGVRRDVKRADRETVVKTTGPHLNKGLSNWLRANTHMSNVYLVGGRFGVWTTDAIEAVKDLGEDPTFTEVEKALSKVRNVDEWTCEVHANAGRYNGDNWNYSPGPKRWESPISAAIKNGSVRVLQEVLKRYLKAGGARKIDVRYTDAVHYITPVQRGVARIFGCELVTEW